jgi:hypothetical protein
MTWLYRHQMFTIKRQERKERFPAEGAQMV